MSKFSLILDFGAPQFRNEATYLIPNINLKHHEGLLLVVLMSC